MAFNKGISFGPREEREDAGMHTRVANDPCRCQADMSLFENKILHEDIT